MKTLVVGSGGREHALCWSLAGSPLIDKLYCAPGSAAIAGLAEPVALRADDIEGLVAFAVEQAIDLVVVGPELPLVLGLVDRLEEAGIRTFGPTAAAARLEGSKAFMKAFAERHGIPTAAWKSFTEQEREAALAHIDEMGAPIVVKADGLAAGKGVVVAETVEEARAAVEDAFDGRFGASGARLVIEECLVGEEASLFALCDGKTALEFGTAQDHKRAFDGDTGPNTGGMGAYSPAPILDAAMVERVMAEIVRPTVAGMAAEGSPYRGFLYAGLMITAEGPKLIEFNVRFGDPECQVVLPRLMTDLGQLLLGATDGQLARMNVRWLDRHALTVVMAAQGYPGEPAKDGEITGLDAFAPVGGDGEEGNGDVMVFHAGTRLDGKIWRAAGGRVLNVTGVSDNLAAAREKAYGAVAKIGWREGFNRSDIGWRALARSEGDGQP
ncbi:MAG: phosphoribosylamine--glycine ligase [Geminicoccaceae bacterium]